MKCSLCRCVIPYRLMPRGKPKPWREAPPMASIVKFQLLVKMTLCSDRETSEFKASMRPNWTQKWRRNLTFWSKGNKRLWLKKTSMQLSNIKRLLTSWRWLAVTSRCLTNVSKKPSLEKTLKLPRHWKFKLTGWSSLSITSTLIILSLNNLMSNKTKPLTLSMILHSCSRWEW